MKTTFAISVLLMSIFILGFSGIAMSRSPGDAVIALEGKLNYPYVSNAGGRVFLQITLTTRGFQVAGRRPMNLCVVLDRSGSMAAEGKITYAKKALYALIDQLTSNDILSIVIYDDVVDILSEARHVRNKSALKRLIERIEPRGSTNLGGGMVEGFRQVGRHFDKEYVNRVVLLSDGLANQGVVDPTELNRIARKYRSRSISLTAMGVGLDYNENLMMGLAESGGGNYYFIESPRNLASMIQKELNALSCVVATNASIELMLGRGVRVVDVIGCEHRLESERYIIPVGDLYANERREFTVELELPEGVGSMVVATGALYYDVGDARVKHGSTFSAIVRYTNDVSLIDKHRDWDIQAKVDVAISTRQVERAMQALDEDRRDAAAQEIAAAKQLLMASPALTRASEDGATVLREQHNRLELYEELVDSSQDVRHTKKAIQFDNYKTQKNRK